MRPRDLQALEFPLVLRRLSDFAQSPGGKQACLDLEPSTDETFAHASLDLAWQCFRLTEKHGRIPLSDFPDVREAMRKAAHPGFILDGAALVEIRRVLDCARRCRAYLGAHAKEIPNLDALRERIDPPPEVHDTLARSLDEEGGVTDEASEELADVRQTVRRLRARLSKRLEGMLDRAGDILSDRFVTLRNNRFVLPIRTMAVGQMDGVVQDRSASGETTFVEPLFAVELNNKLLVAAKEEERIIRKILADLTDLVRQESAAVEATYGGLVQLDVVHARAGFTRRYYCTQPRFDDTEVRLLEARHPVLMFSDREVVPVDLVLPRGKMTLAITGPNTGGKTVALKTLGLLAAMAQSGIPIPAGEGSCLPCFRSIFADVGDEQSIERDLSTFSGHLANIKEILERHAPPALVLLDEPGVGTDPEEGAALGIGVLQRLEAIGARVVVTTHYASVKAFALARDTFQTAAVSFDVEKMEPSYMLAYHSVGESLAVPIARRLGLPEEILEAAEAARSQEARDFSEAMRELEESRRHYESILGEAERQLREARAKRAEVDKLTAELQRKKKAKWADELKEAKVYIRGLREEGRDLLRNLERGDRSRRRLDEFVRRGSTEIQQREKEVEEAPAPSGPVAVGDQVEVPGSQLRGELLKIEGDRAWIQKGTMRFEVPAEPLRKVSGSSPKEKPKNVQVAVGLAVGRGDEAASMEISLLGMRVKEALATLEPFLDRAVRDGVPSVRIIHGLGSGALRKAVTEYLADSPYCSTYRQGRDAEGGAGVTIADLG